MEISISRAGIEVIDRLEPLWLALHEHHQKAMPDAVYQPRDASWAARRSAYVAWLADPGSFILLAHQGSDLVGYALVEVRPGPDDTWVTGARMAELQTLSVAPETRGQGVGTLLLDRVDAELDAAGIGDLFIAALHGNDAAIRLYQRRGLRPVAIHLARFAADRGSRQSEAVSTSSPGDAGSSQRKSPQPHPAGGPHKDPGHAGSVPYENPGQTGNWPA
jgi:ribosomal protein S18 acetylase RimI-like enzyme